MTLPSSGPISLSQVNTELGLSSTALITMNDSAVRTLFQKTGSGTTISMSDGYGKANQFAFTISSNQTNANLRTLAVNAGWNQSSKVVATIGSGVYISSNSTGTAALTVNGSFPGGVELINTGLIIGMGGAGGNAPNVNNGSLTSSATNGGAGGLALSVSVAISINNGSGTIGGGGGGGGAGETTALNNCAWENYGGGGGGGGRSSNAANSAGGSGGVASGGAFNASGTGGGAGTVSGAGGGGTGGGFPSFKAGNGSSGGGWGSSGTNGSARNTPGWGNATGATATSGGSGGGAVSGNSNITWLATGTRLGGIS